MPQVDAEYLLGYLFDVGPVVGTGAGGVALRSEHLIHWQEETGIPLQPWECRFLRRLSNEYLAESYRAEKIDCKEPMRESADYVPDLSVVAKNLQQTLKELANL